MEEKQDIVKETTSGILNFSSSLQIIKIVSANAVLMLVIILLVGFKEDTAELFMACMVAYVGCIYLLSVRLLKALQSFKDTLAELERELTRRKLHSTTTQTNFYKNIK